MEDSVLPTFTPYIRRPGHGNSHASMAYLRRSPGDMEARKSRIDGGKVDQRFSMLIFESSHAAVGNEAEEEGKGERSRVKRILGRMFGSSWSGKSMTMARQRGEAEERLGGKTDRAVGEAAAEGGLKRYSILRRNNFGTMTPTPQSESHPREHVGPAAPEIQSKQHSVLHERNPQNPRLSHGQNRAAAPTTLPSFSPHDILPDSKHKQKAPSHLSAHDSKRSSVSSTDTPYHPILQRRTFPTALPTPPPSRRTSNPHVSAQIYLSPQQFNRLQSVTRRMGRRLKQQDYLSSSLSANLFGILTRKAAMVKAHLGQGRARQREMAGMLAAISRTSDACAAIFLRKAVLAQSSCSSLQKLRFLVRNTRSGDEMTIPAIDSSRHPPHAPGYLISKEGVFDAVREMQWDIILQKELDVELGGVVKQVCAEERWVGSPREGIMMCRFLGFLDERLKVSWRCLEGLGVLLGGVEETLREF